MFVAGCRFLGFRMPDELRSPIKHHLVLHKCDPERRVARFYSLMIERDLFGTMRLVRNWGRIGANGQELVEIHEDEISAGQALLASSSPGYTPEVLCLRFATEPLPNPKQDAGTGRVAYQPDRFMDPTAWKTPWLRDGRAFGWGVS
jgi:predicted DNA-binding WGR domain protein